MNIKNPIYALIAFILAVLCALAAVYFFLWLISSSDLDFVPCHGNYSLDAPNPQCHRPVIAAITFLSFATATVILVCVEFILRHIRRRTKVPKPKNG